MERRIEGTTGRRDALKARVEDRLEPERDGTLVVMHARKLLE
ncbi:MAG TPA: hypothetical protein VF502_19035 [Stellaceae bacterium]